MSAQRVGGRDPGTGLSARALAMAVALIALAPVLFVATPASAFWSVSTTALSVGAASAATVNQGSTPTASVASKNRVTLTWSATTLSNGAAVTGYTVTRYNVSNSAVTPLNGCSGTILGITCTETAVPDGRWTYRVTPRVGTNWVGAQGASSNQVLTDATAPVNNISVVPQAGVWQNANTVWVRTSEAAGNFRLSNALTDATSGPRRSATAALTGTFGGFSHTAGSVTTPTGGPYVSAPYSWTLGATGTPTARITGRDALLNTAITNIAIRPDNTAPSGGVIEYQGGQRASNKLTITLESISDSESGLSRGTRWLQLAQTPRSGATCGTAASWTNIVENPGPSVVVTVGSGCNQYRYVFTDSVGNETVSTKTGNANVTIDYYDVVLATPGLLSYWTLDEFEGNLDDEIWDSVEDGEYNDGEWWWENTPPTFNQTGAIRASNRKSVLLNGADQFGSVEREIEDNFSVEFWFKSEQGRGGGPWWGGAGLVDAETAGGANDFGVSLSATGNVLAGVGGAPGGDLTITSASGKNDGNWHHVVFARTRVTGSIVLYVDGVQVDSGTGGTQLLDSSFYIDFGRIQTGGNYYEGNLDEIAVYSTALSSATVKEHYDVGQLP